MIWLFTVLLVLISIRRSWNCHC